MTLTLVDAAPVPHTDLNRFAWSGLRRFHHVPSVAERIMKKHNVPKNHQNNVVKQANQIRHCLIQAQEYKEAASVTSLATRPLLLYYSLMSLALAQILYKGTGATSLDAARGEHAHHGLVFTVMPTSKSDFSLEQTASSLRASPMIVSNRRRGTFELWHSLSREDPLVGRTITHQAGGSTTSNAQVIMASSDKRMGYLEEGGMSLHDCFVGSPGLSTWLGAVGARTKIVRGQIEVEKRPEIDAKINFVLHPHFDKARYEELAGDFMFSASAHTAIDAHEFDNGCAFTINLTNDSQIGVNIPSASSWTNRELKFLPKGAPFNEFGYIYVGLYILGNYARYHPDKWIADVEAGTPLALTSEEFISMAEWRMALLTLSELSEKYFVPIA